jgi:hypothetical protein
MQYLMSMNLWRQMLIVLGLVVLLGTILPATPSGLETIEAFCESFDDGTGWQGRWTTTVGSQTAVDTIWHSATQSIQFRGSCHSAMCRSGFSGAQGEYEAHVNQQHHQAGFAMHIQVQGGLGNPMLLEGYTFRLQASDAQAPGTMVLGHSTAGGAATILGTETPTQFVKGEWIKVFIRRSGMDTIVAGYERPTGFRDSIVGVDPNPITTPGSFYLWACCDVTPYTFFDDVCFNKVSHLSFPSAALAPCDSAVALQPVKVDLSKPAIGGVVTFKIPAGVAVSGISTAGLPTSAWDQVQYQPQSGYSFVRLNNTLGLRLPADTSTLFFIKFMTNRLCRQDKYIHWDTAQSADPSRKTAFTDTLFATFYPEFDGNRDSTEIQGFEPGDVDNSGGVDITDLTALIDFLYISFTPLCLSSAANVDGNCTNPNIDISDLTRLIDFLYVSFNPLECCPPNPAARPVAAIQDGDYSVSASDENGRTILSLNGISEVKGAQFELTGPMGEQPISLVGDGLKVYSGWKEGVLHIGIVDPTGKQSIPSGKTHLLTLNGEFKILAATLAGPEHRSITPQIGSAASITVPTEYMLSQNYPNPFNPATTISFAMPQAGYAKLDIYNTLGQLVVTVFDEKLEAGVHSVTWDASDQASGLYLYRLTTGDFAETRKMLLLK